MQLHRLAHGGRRVVRQQRRDLERRPAIYARRRIMNGTEQVGGLGQILERQIEEQCFARSSARARVANGVVF